MNKITKSLEYNLNSFSTAYSNEFITGFNHGSMAQGPVVKSEVTKIVKVINEKLDCITKAINFREDLVVDNLSGGSCSSIALKIALIALNYLKQTQSDNQDLTEKIKKTVEEINKSSSSKRKGIRNIQAALNTINIDASEKVEDICQHKIKALAAYFDMKVCHSTGECLIEETEVCKEWFEDTTKKLNDGVYLFRIIQHENNHKLETQGHSTIYIKNGTDELYFDTQIGLYKIHDAREIIYQSVCSAKKRFEVDSCKFHQLSIGENV